MIRIVLVAGLLMLAGCADRVRHTCETDPTARRCQEITLP